MAKLTPQATIEFQVHFSISEVEARALEAMVGYGSDAFIEVFYEKLGRAYMERHEKGLRTLFESIKNVVPSTLHKIDEARKVLKLPQGY